MKPILFSVDDRNAMLTALNYVYDYDNVSILQHTMAIDRYGALYDSVYDKLMDYCALTHITNEEYAVLEDALVAVLPAVEPKYLNVFVQVTKKVQSICEANADTAVDPSCKP